jgi:hypothetical protein
MVLTKFVVHVNNIARRHGGNGAAGGALPERRNAPRPLPGGFFALVRTGKNPA